MKRWTWWALTMAMIAIGFLGMWQLSREAPHSKEGSASSPAPVTPSWTREGNSFPWRELSPVDVDQSKRRAVPLGAIGGQRTVTFASEEAMRAFLASIGGTGIRVIGSIDSLNTLRLSLSNASELDGLLDGSEEIGFIFPAVIPGQGSIQEGAVAFGNRYLPWLGAEGERGTWGTDVAVAVLDTGVAQGAPFANTVIHNHFIELPGNPADMNRHGTAVASLIAGEGGLAPNATILSYRVAGDDGMSDTFLIAQAVLEATNAGADIINISMGSNGSSRILEEAVQQASQAGVVVVASAGNSGVDYLFYPAAYPEVVGVGAIDARGEHLDFSNTGDPSIVAPGLGLTSSIGATDRISFSGTSASSPVVAGAIAATMTLMTVDASSAWQQVALNANEAGAPGVDPAYGSGILDVGRIIDSGVSGINDVALASNHVTVNSSGFTVLQVTVENRGTESVINAPVSVTTPFGNNDFNVASLAPGEIQTFELFINPINQPTRIQSSVGAGLGDADSNPENNVRVDLLTPVEQAP